jgi:hypothetical protein
MIIKNKLKKKKMLSNNIKLNASVSEVDGENLLQITSNGNTYGLSDIHWVFDYVGPTGVISKEGLLREVHQSDFEAIIENGGECKVQQNERGEFILHYIPQPE